MGLRESGAWHTLRRCSVLWLLVLGLPKEVLGAFGGHCVPPGIPSAAVPQSPLLPEAHQRVRADLEGWIACCKVATLVPGKPWPPQQHSTPWSWWLATGICAGLSSPWGTRQSPAELEGGFPSPCTHHPPTMKSENARPVQNKSWREIKPAGQKVQPSTACSGHGSSPARLAPSVGPSSPGWQGGNKGGASSWV